MKKLHLICNSHIDPIWLWDFEEGAAAAISTFRSAAELTNEHDYVFNHNEVTLYQWINEYEPELFKKIQELVKKGKWHIMGGWYLQPDCNMPSGESLVRQAGTGRQYFKKHFNKTPTTAINFDPFGHSVGLVQILKKCGYDSYLFCRPYPDQLALKNDRFIWKGLDGSEIKCFRSSMGYLTLLGETAEKIKKYIAENESVDIGMFLWGVGNHGGGPSRKDLEDISKLMKESDVQIVHSTPEEYFSEFNNYTEYFDKSLYPSMIGCYTSMMKVKQRHRELENMLYSTEKMCAVAAASGIMPYPHDEINEAQKDMLSAEFHDILPGTAIKSGEKTGIRMLEHGLENIYRIRAKAFFALTGGFDKVVSEAYPIFVFNPHPYEVKETIECEFMLANQNWGDDFTFFNAYDGEEKLPSQIVKEVSNLNLDWRKKVMFECTLKPMSINRFECRPYRVPKKPTYEKISGKFTFKNDFYSIVLSAETGLIDSFKTENIEFLKNNAFKPLLINDTEDPWGMSSAQLIKLGEIVDEFKLADTKTGSNFSGLKNSEIPSVRIIEDGEVATIVEAVLSARNSFILVKYYFYKHQAHFDITYKVLFNEKSMAIKLMIPSNINGEYVGEVPFGYESLFTDGREVPSQKWCALTNDKTTLSIINNSTYGSSMENGNIYLTLLRSPAYSAHPILKREIIPSDRYIDRMDLGESEFSFRVFAGETKNILPSLSAKALVFNEKPFPLNIYPSGKGKKATPVIILDNDKITMSALKCNENNEMIVRFFNNNKIENSAVVTICNKKTQKISFKKFEVKTYKIVNESLVELETMEI